MNNDVVVNKLNEINKMLKNKEIDAAEKELDELLSKTEVIEIDEHGRVLDFENEVQFVLYINSLKEKINIQWNRTYISDMYQFKGSIYIDKGEYDEAIKYFKLALKWNPMKVSTYMEIMEIYIRTKDWNKFEEYFNKSLQLVTNPIEVSIIYRKYAYFCIELKNYELAYNILRYTALIFYRKENEDEINYISSILKMDLKKVPDIGNVEYIKARGLEFKVNPILINTYLAIIQGQNKEIDKDTYTDEQRISYLKKFNVYYNNLYLLCCNDDIHAMQLENNNKLLNILNRYNKNKEEQ